MVPQDTRTFGAGWGSNAPVLTTPGLFIWPAQGQAAPAGWAPWGGTVASGRSSVNKGGDEKTEAQQGFLLLTLASHQIQPQTAHL